MNQLPPIIEEKIRARAEYGNSVPNMNEIRKRWREGALMALEAMGTPVPERMAPVQGYSAGIPWSMHLRAYDAYCKKYRPQKALIEGWCRGGFGTQELDEFIPGWREELSEINKLKAERDKLQAFKTFVHSRLDEMGIPSHPDGEHSKAGCRIGDRLDIIVEETIKAGKVMEQLQNRVREAENLADRVIAFSHMNKSGGYNGPGREPEVGSIYDMARRLKGIGGLPQ